jgi:hypothetical protein
MAVNATACDVCGGPLPPYKGNGRPRKRCEPCAADKAALAKRWKAQHPEYQEAHNASRRLTLAERNARRWNHALRVRR